MKIIATIEGVKIGELEDGNITFTAKAAIDADGSGPKTPGDTFLPDTSLHWRGKALNAQVDRFIVVPPVIIRSVKGIVLGCQARVTNLRNGMSTDAVVGDIGPRNKLGEISVACAKALGINPSPISGGIDAHVIHYSLWPGVPAHVEEKVYSLWPSS